MGTITMTSKSELAVCGLRIIFPFLQVAVQPGITQTNCIGKCRQNPANPGFSLLASVVCPVSHGQVYTDFLQASLTETIGDEVVRINSL